MCIHIHHRSLPLPSPDRTRDPPESSHCFRHTSASAKYALRCVLLSLRHLVHPPTSAKAVFGSHSVRINFAPPTQPPPTFNQLLPSHFQPSTIRPLQPSNYLPIYPLPCCSPPRHRPHINMNRGPHNRDEREEGSPVTVRRFGSGQQSATPGPVPPDTPATITNI